VKPEHRNTVNANFKDEGCKPALNCRHQFYTTAWSWRKHSAVYKNYKGRRPLQAYVTLLVADDEDGAVCCVNANLPRGK